MKDLICIKCGYERKGIIDDDFECALCGSEMIIIDDDIGHYEEIKEFIPKFTELKMRNDILLYGNDKVWNIIEGKKLPIRLEYRKIFFNIGGSVPETEI